MCLFPKKNLNTSGIAYHKGVTEFVCGCCPECLKKKSNLWALRCSMEAKVSSAIMVTLTYDTYIRQNGEIIGERVSDLKVCKEDVQKFIKRVRRYFDYHYGVKNIKYLICAEYGKRTGRAHYHAILFNTPFNDYIYYKKSKRGNIIYKSPLLTKLWGNGICTVDSISCNSAIARYCTKYCAKDSNRCDDTFMLFSQGIGDKMLFETFNGKSYIIDGQEYAIPKLVWNKLIQKKIDKNRNKYVRSKLNVLEKLGFNVDKYKNIKPTYKYRSYKDKINLYSELTINSNDIILSLIRESYIKKHIENIYARELFIMCKEFDTRFIRYLDYWNKKAVLYDKYLKTPFERLQALPDDKYFMYKQASLIYLSDKRKQWKHPPRFNEENIKKRKVSKIRENKDFINRYIKKVFTPPFFSDLRNGFTDFKRILWCIYDNKNYIKYHLPLSTLSIKGK